MAVQSNRVGSVQMKLALRAYCALQGTEAEYDHERAMMGSPERVDHAERSMITFLLLNAIFWTGTLLVVAIRPPGLDRVFAASIFGFTLIVISLILLSPFAAIRLYSIALLCVGVLFSGIALQYARGGIHGVSKALRFRFGKLHDLSALMLGAMALWAALHYLLYGLIWPVRPISDAPIYHLPFALRWWQSGAVQLVPTPFGEEGATYFPAGGELWLTWVSVTSGGAPIIKVGQWPFLALGASALYALGRQMGGTRWSSIVPASCWCVTPLVLTQSALANVDLIWTAYYFIGLFYFVQFSRRLRRGETALFEALLLGSSLGIVLGTKSVGLLFVPLLVAPALCKLWGCCSAPRARLVPTVAAGHLGLLALGLTVPGVYWYLRNTWWTGNPLYPLQVSPLGFTLLPGWCSRANMVNTAYHVPISRLDVLVGRFFVVAGVVPTLVWCGAVLGAVLACLRRHRSPADWTAGGFALFAVLHLFLYWVMIPYNTQERFLLPCLGIGLLPLARLLKRWRSLMPVIVGATVVHLFVLGPGSFRSGPLVPLAGNVLTLGNVWATAALPLALLMAAALWRHGWAVGRATAVLAVVCGAYLYACPAAQELGARPNDRFYPRGGFAERMRDAWLIVERFNRRQVTRVAYTGTNLPYYLYGSHLRNQVFYVAVNEHPQWLPHDYHRLRRRNKDLALPDDPWPQWYRSDLDYEAWLNNLRRAHVQLLFVARENQHGRLLELDEPPPFPIEKQWADAHPELFEDLGPKGTAADGIAWARVYRLRPGN